MVDLIIWYIINIGCGLLFFGIGIYANRIDKPMHFYSNGEEIDPSTISDIKKYNRANSIMWKIYSLFYFASAISYSFNEIVAIIILCVNTLGGIPVLVLVYNKILKKYEVK